MQTDSCKSSKPSEPEFAANDNGLPPAWLATFYDAAAAEFPFNQVRYYFEDMSLYFEADPIGLAGMTPAVMSPFPYGEQNPINYIEPSETSSGVGVGIAEE
jgi:hypothetical protein